MKTVYVVTNPKKGSTWVFSNHDAALRCRETQNLSQERLVGCVIFDDWRDGQPWHKELDDLGVGKLGNPPPLAPPCH
jgi:hypothetical protein